MDEDVVPQTVNKDLRATRRFLNWAVEKRYLRVAPKFKSAFVPEDDKLPVVIPRAEYEAMLAALNSGEVKLTKRPAAWWRLFLQLAYQLGPRRNEILELRWAEVDFEKAELTILSETSKGRKSRILPLMPELVAAWRAWRQAWPNEEKVLRYDGNVRHLYDDFHRFAGDRVPKNCRSSTGSLLVAAGVPTVIVRDFLGHSSVTITEKHYVNTSGTLRAAAEARRAAS